MSLSAQNPSPFQTRSTLIPTNPRKINPSLLLVRDTEQKTSKLTLHLKNQLEAGKALLMLKRVIIKQLLKTSKPFRKAKSMVRRRSLASLREEHHPSLASS